MKYRFPLVAALAVAVSSAWASEPALPSADLKQADAATTLTVPAAPVADLMDEDSKALGQAMRYGVVQRVDRALVGGSAAAGSWSELADGRLLWTLDVASDDAVSLDLHFSRFDLPASAELFLASKSADYVLGPIRGSDALADGQYYSPLIPGDQTRIEVVVDAAERDAVALTLAGITYGYRGILGLQDHPDAIRSGACNIDVACPLGEGWDDQIDAVGQYIFTRPNGSFVCTGSLIANTNGTPIPYFITANHCVSTESVAQTMRIYWNYQSPTCRTPGSSQSGTPLPRPATFSNGASLRMTYASNDTSLVELNAPVPEAENPFFVGWDRRNLATPGNPQVSDAVSIHHPAGHEKRITKDDDSLSVTTYLSDTATPAGSHYRIGQWEHGTTEGGSSGSALFTPDGHLIGTLHGGYAACNSITQDWYGRIHQSWAGGGSDATRLSTWLDPAASAPEIFDGYRGEPLDEADLEITLNAGPNPVDIGEELNILIDVQNFGPGDADNVSVELSLPTGLAYTATTATDWTCTATGGSVDCALAGTLASNDSTETLAITADVVAVETGTVTINATVSGSNPDPDTENNSASADIVITGEPPLPDAIFCDGFEDGGDGSCGSPVDPDIVDSGEVNIAVPASVGETGFSINWVTGATCNCDTDPGYHFNPYAQTGGLLSVWFWPGSAGQRGGLVQGGKFPVLASGATIGPESTFDAPGGTGQATAMADWRAGADGYFGFRFTNPDTGAVNYGYAHLTTVSGGGFPLTIVRYWYNSAGNAITIP